MNYSLLKSKTFWTIIVMFIVGGGNAIVPVLPPAWDTVVMAVLSTLAAVFHLDTAQKFGAHN